MSIRQLGKLLKTARRPKMDGQTCDRIAVLPASGGPTSKNVLPLDFDLFLLAKNATRVIVRQCSISDVRGAKYQGPAITR